MNLSRTRCAQPLRIAVALVSILTSPARAGIPDLSQSYYVPQAGPLAPPREGTNAIRFFTTCPNNDSAPLLLNARIKIVVRDVNGNLVANVPAADICVLINSGTSAQGYTGTGADSLIANGAWNSSPMCPTVTCLFADAPTDESGTTYITFAGSTPGSPGIATRDPSRKWGHYDSELPVYVMGYKIPGRLLPASANGSYVLRIKNVDVVGGLDARANRGEKVNYLDLNAFAQNAGGNCLISYWVDFDHNGTVGASDLNLFNAHMGHDCDSPNNP